MPPFVAAEGLHGGVVDDLGGMTESFGEIHAHPTAAEVVGLAERVAINDRAGIADGDAVELPAFDGQLDVANGAGGGHGGAGDKFGGFLLAGHEEFYVGATDIDDQDFGVYFGVHFRVFLRVFGRRRLGDHLLPPAGMVEGIPASGGSQTRKWEGRAKDSGRVA